MVGRTEPEISFVARRGFRRKKISGVGMVMALCFMLTAWQLHARERKKEKKEDFGLGFSVEVAAPESEVEDAIETVINNGIIEGSREYNKDKFVDKAVPVSTSPLFSKWTQPGKIFYKVRADVLAPVNFSESRDEGTLAVRYIVQGRDINTSVLRIDAVFVEDLRHTTHASNGSVETAEYKAIQDQIDAAEQQKKQALDAQDQREQELARRALEKKREEEQSAALLSAPVQTLEGRVQDLRKQVERLAKAPGASLKSAPFQSATTLKALQPGSEVVILIVTPYWYGVETEDGEHGWIHRSQLEPVP